MIDKDLLYEEIYKNTQGYGRTQLVKLIQMGQIKIEQLQEENKYLKEKLENSLEINVADHKYASEMEDNYLVEHNILNEFEKYIEEQSKMTFDPWVLKILDKLQELKKEMS